MQTFRYKAAGNDGHVSEGHIDAPDRDAAARLLQTQGKVPLSIDAADALSPTQRPAHKRSGGAATSASAIDYFTLELATLLRAELPLGQALETLASTAEDAAMAERAAAINKAVRSGKSLSTALAESGPEFDAFYCNMVRAGESGGALGLALERLASFRRHRRETQQAIVSALLYPAILLVLAVVAVAVMLAFVVPQFTQMFADAGRELPMLTRIVAGAGEIVTHWWWLILLGIGALVTWLYRDWQSPAGRARWDGWLLRLPLLGTTIRKNQTARFARTLATLLENGVHLLPALEIAQEIVGNSQIARALTRATQRVREGAGLAAPLGESAVLPALAIKLIALGESSGKLEFMLLQIADIYERDVQTAMKRLFTLAEPVIIVTIALMITVIILSVVLVILESNDLAF
ncbi:MAG: type II secretion system F family protein [Gammaproteobacteria bacterium]|nr:type II secretion system F family protein [Gammaproteobacteria bacterium]